MSIVVGVAPEESGSAALALAAMLARSAGEDLVVTTVVPLPWPPRPAAMDAEYREHLKRRGEQALARARAELDHHSQARFELREARSVPASLAEAAEEHGAVSLVLGSSTGGAFGRVSFGSVLDRILHGANVPVAIAPRGFRCTPNVRVRRLTVAFGGDSANAHELLQATSTITARIDATLRVASFFLRPATALTGTIEESAEDLVMASWAAEAKAAIQTTLDDIAAGSQPPKLVETVIGDGYTWAAAIEDVPWDDGDLLVIGSSASGPLAQVFLGSRASKIIRHSPVPVLVLPRAAVEDRIVDDRAAPAAMRVAP